MLFSDSKPQIIFLKCVDLKGVKTDGLIEKSILILEVVFAFCSLFESFFSIKIKIKSEVVSLLQKISACIVFIIFGVMLHTLFALNLISCSSDSYSQSILWTKWNCFVMDRPFSESHELMWFVPESNFLLRNGTTHLVLKLVLKRRKEADKRGRN